MTRSLSIAFLSGLLGCVGGGHDCPPAPDAGARADASTSELTAALEGATLTATCSGPNVLAMLFLDLESATAVVLPTGEQGITLIAVGNAAVSPPAPESISRGVSLQNVSIPCVARFQPVQGGVLYLALLCQLPAESPGAGGALVLDIHAVTDGAGVVQAESAQIVGMSDGTSLCDGTLMGHTFTYAFTLAAEPSMPVVNTSRTVTGG